MKHVLAEGLSIAGFLAKTQVLWLQSVDSPCGYKLHTQFEQRRDQQPEERMFLKSKSIHGLGCRSSLEIAESKHMVRAWMRWKADRVRCMAAGLNRIDSIIWVVGHWHFHEVCLNCPSTGKGGRRYHQYTSNILISKETSLARTNTSSKYCLWLKMSVAP